MSRPIDGHAGVARAAVAGLHDPRPAAGDDREARAAQHRRRLARLARTSGRRAACAPSRRSRPPCRRARARSKPARSSSSIRRAARGVVELGDDRRRVGLEQLLVGRGRRARVRAAELLLVGLRPDQARRRDGGSSRGGPCVQVSRAGLDGRLRRGGTLHSLVTVMRGASIGAAARARARCPAVARPRRCRPLATPRAEDRLRASSCRTARTCASEARRARSRRRGARGRGRVGRRQQPARA